jgi:hypothetical protein
MNRLGLSHHDLGTYHDALTWTHRRRIHVHILDLDMNLIRSVSPMFLDGQVTVDTTAEVSRILTLSFLDPTQSLAFEPDTPGPALWRNRLLRIVYSVSVPDLNDWVDCPVFTGVVWDFSRQGAMVNVTAQGLERLALGQAWTGKKYPAKSTRTDGAEGHHGPRRRGLPRDPRPAVQAPEGLRRREDGLPVEAGQAPRGVDEPLPVLRRPRDAASAALQRPARVHLRQGGADPADVRPVEGPGHQHRRGSRRPAEGQEARVKAVATATGWLSPKALARASGSLRLVQQIQNDHIRSNAEAKAIAVRHLKHHEQQRVTITFDSLPVPHLEENDRVRVGSTGVGPVHLRLNQFTIPLGGGDGTAPPMTVGSVRRTTRPGYAGVRSG